MICSGPAAPAGSASGRSLNSREKDASGARAWGALRSNLRWSVTSQRSALQPIMARLTPASASPEAVRPIAGWTAQAGAKQLHEVFSRIAMPRETFEFRAFTRLKQLEYLISSGQLDSELYWKY